jgi:hypothetical protein
MTNQEIQNHRAELLKREQEIVRELNDLYGDCRGAHLVGELEDIGARKKMLTQLDQIKAWSRKSIGFDPLKTLISENEQAFAERESSITDLIETY